MPRTTLNIEKPVLEDLKRLQKRERKSLGRLVSELLVEALGMRKARTEQPRSFRWFSQPMGAHVDLRDKEAVQAILDQDSGVPPFRSSLK